MEQLTLAIAERLESLLNEGFDLPMQFAAIAVNGSSINGSYEPDDEGGLKPKITAQSFEAAGFQLPINIMFVDALGRMAHLVIEVGGKAASAN
jgi:hypothetical protein